MDWSKVNFDEMGYVFKSTRSHGDLECCPFSLKIDSILDMLNYYQVESFDHDDIHRLFQILRLKNSQGKVVIPSANKIKARLEKVDYQIEFSQDCYKTTLEEGYKKGYIADWANWAIKNNDVCEALSRNNSCILNIKNELQ